MVLYTWLDSASIALSYVCIPVLVLNFGLHCHSQVYIVWTSGHCNTTAVWVYPAFAARSTLGCPGYRLVGYTDFCTRVQTSAWWCCTLTVQGQRRGWCVFGWWICSMWLFACAAWSTLAAVPVLVDKSMVLYLDNASGLALHVVCVYLGNDIWVINMTQDDGSWMEWIMLGNDWTACVYLICVAVCSVHIVSYVVHVSSCCITPSQLSLYTPLFVASALYNVDYKCFLW